jgi:restriction endonuclease Mrr
MVGQAKHYPTGQVATPEIRELVGSVELARAGAWSRVSSPYLDMKLRLCDPVFFLFFTTGTISASGWRLLGASGVVGMDGEMLAAFLADHDVGVIGDTFDAPALAEWIASDAPE